MITDTELRLRAALAASADEVQTTPRDPAALRAMLDAGRPLLPDHRFVGPDRRSGSMRPTGPTRRTRRVWRPVLIGAAVAALVVAVALVGLSLQEQGSRPADHEVTPVPTAPATASAPPSAMSSLPSSVPAPASPQGTDTRSTTTATAGRPADCTAEQLSASVDPNRTGPTAGTENIIILFRNISAKPCWLSGVPTLFGVAENGSATLLPFGASPDPQYSVPGLPPGVVAPNGLGYLHLTMTINPGACHEPPVRYDKLKIRVPSGGSVILQYPDELTESGCFGDMGELAPDAGTSGQTTSSTTTPQPPATTTGGSGSSIGSDASATAGGVALSGQPCLVGLTSAWTSALTSGTLWTDLVSAHPGYAPTSDGSGVLIARDESGYTDVSILGRNQRVVTDLGHIANPQPLAATYRGKIYYSTAAGDDVAFVWVAPGASAGSPDLWTLYLGDVSAGTLTAVAHSPAVTDGSDVISNILYPTMAGHYLYWSQASASVKGWGGSSLMQYDLTSHQTRTLYRGVLGAYVAYGSEVIYSAIAPDAPAANTAAGSTGAGPTLQMHAVDAATGRSLPPPAGLDIAGALPNEVRTNGDVIAWTTGLAVYAWRPSWGRTITLMAQAQSWPPDEKAAMSGFTELRIYQNFVVWSGEGTHVLDLTTNSWARLIAAAGSDELAGSWLALSYSTTAVDQAKADGVEAMQETLIDLAGLPHLPSCSGS